MTTIELLGWTVVHRNVTEYPLTGSKVLLTVAETLLGMISPELTVANSTPSNPPATRTNSDVSISICERKTNVHNQRMTVLIKISPTNRQMSYAAHFWAFRSSYRRIGASR